MKRYGGNLRLHPLFEMPDGNLVFYTDALAYADAKVKEAVEKEREACVLDCEGAANGFHQESGVAILSRNVAKRCVEAIRARNTT